MNPRQEYQGRLEKRRAEFESLQRIDGRLANARFAAFAAFAILLIAAAAYDAVNPFGALPLLAAFIALVIWHARVIERGKFAQRAVAFYQTALARLDGRWQDQPATGEGLAAEDHPYAVDLDLFGKGSLFQLLCAARTRAGEEALALWLSAPAESEEIRARQEAVEELRQNLDLREDLALLGESLRSQVRPAQLRAWATRPDSLTGTWGLSAARLLAVFVLLAFFGWISFGFPALPLILSVPVAAILQRWKGRLAEESLRGFREPEKDLLVLATVARRIEQETFQCAWLSARQGKLRAGAKQASDAIAALGRRLDWLDAQANPFFAPFAYMLLWRFHFAASIEAWRKESGSHVGDWLEAIGELEAIASISMYAYENENDIFPEISDSAQALFEAEGLGHPLLPAQTCIANDVALTPKNALWVVSGSNMSGKSTLLRSVGVAAVMAFAGAPVRAAKLHLTPLHIGASICILDSIQSGRSRFYAEIQRIRDIVELARGHNALFLIDEALHGTNSHDRRIGASAILRTLVGTGAIGLVTTHDLALTEPLEQYGDGIAANWHFQDRLEDGELIFDYTLRPGVVQKSNAIDLMRSIGLDV